MKKSTCAAMLSVVVAACGSSPGSLAPPASTMPVSTTASSGQPTTTAPTSSTADPGDGDVASTCDAIEVAIFDLDSALQTAIGSLDPTVSSELSDLEAAELVLTPVVGFSETLSALSATAPGDVAGDLADLAAGMVPLADALESGRTEDLESMFDASEEIPFTGAEAVDRWVSANCGVETSLDPAVLVADSLMTAVFSGLGDALTGLEEGFGDLESIGELSESGDSNMALGDDPELDALWSSCEAGDDGACDELYWQTFGMYELFAQTCGGRAPYHPNSGGACEARLDLDGPSGYGADFYLDSLWDDCAQGDAFSCDLLAGGAPIGSAYQDHGARCGGKRERPTERPCGDTDQPYAYGDDAVLDGQWEACNTGDGEACRDLWFDAPIGSEYESMGDACGALLDRDRTCEQVTELLAAPVG